MSSLIKSIEYSEGEGTLTLQLGDHGIYRYIDVPGEIYSELVNAVSKGKYFNLYIRNSYTFTKEQDDE